MAVLETIRVKFGVLITVLIAVALLSFIVDPSSIQSFFGSNEMEVAEVDGESISYQEYQAKVEEITTAWEVQRGSSSLTDQESMSIRNEAWQAVLDNKVFIPNAEKAGIFVGDGEMSLLVYKGWSPIFSQNPVFMNEQGIFDPVRVEEFKEVTAENPMYQAYWNYLMANARNYQYHLKYSNILMKSNFKNSLMIENEVAVNNNTFDVEFLMVPQSYQKDSTIVVSDEEIKNYYEAHKSLYRQNASKNIEYAVFEIEPSAEDITALSDEMDKLCEEFKTADNNKSFLQKNKSVIPFKGQWYKKGDLNYLSSDLEKFVASHNSGVSNVISDEDSYFVAKVVAKSMIPDSLHLRHILLQDEAGIADSLVNLLKTNKAKFEDLVVAHSVDYNQNTVAPGDIDWWNQNMAESIPGMEILWTTPVKKPVIVKSSYGTHIFEVVETTPKVEKKQVAILQKNVKAGKKTVDAALSKAKKFAALAKGGADAFNKAKDSLGVYAHPFDLQVGANRLGAIEDTRNVTSWAFGAEVGDVSTVLNAKDSYIVAVLKDSKEPGYQPLENVSMMISNMLYYQKALDKKVEEVAAQVKDLPSLEAMAEVLGVTVSTKEDVSFSSVMGQSMDPKFIGAASGAEKDVITGPVAGNNGVYIFKVTNRETGEFFTAEDAKNSSMQMDAIWADMSFPVMMEAIEINDYRHNFYN